MQSIHIVHKYSKQSLLQIALWYCFLIIMTWIPIQMIRDARLVNLHARAVQYDARAACSQSSPRDTHSVKPAKIDERAGMAQILGEIARWRLLILGCSRATLKYAIICCCMVFLMRDRAHNERATDSELFTSIAVAACSHHQWLRCAGLENIYAIANEHHQGLYAQ